MGAISPPPQYKQGYEVRVMHSDLKYKQEAVKASNSPRGRKDGIRMAKKIFEGGNYSVTMIYSWGGMHSIGLMSGEEAYFYS